MQKQVFYSLFFIVTIYASGFCAAPQGIDDMREKVTDYHSMLLSAINDKSDIVSGAKFTPDKIEPTIYSWILQFLNDDYIEGVLLVIKDCEALERVDLISSILRDKELHIIVYVSGWLSFYSEYDLYEQKRKIAQELYNKLLYYLNYSLVYATARLDLVGVEEFLSLGAHPEGQVNFYGKMVSAMDVIRNIVGNPNLNCGAYYYKDYEALVHKISTSLQSRINALLFNAIDDGDVEWVESLLCAGAYVWARNSSGGTPSGVASILCDKYGQDMNRRIIVNKLFEHSKRLSYEAFWLVAELDAVIAK